MKDEYLSAGSEPAFQDGGFEADPGEGKADRPRIHDDEIASIRDSVMNEPAITGAENAPYLGKWIQRKRSECSLAGNLGVGVLAALLGGPFAVLGAFMGGTGAWYGWLYIIVFGPVIEEILKQSGMIYLLEKRPYRVFASWQFVFSASVSALVFATIENLLYIYVYPSPSKFANPETYACYRWTVCTGMHLGCSMIASVGMIRVWKKQLANGKVADISVAHGFFCVAICIHGVYNLGALIFEKFFM
ncbi:MAG: hypothetical protein DRP65_12545 [Planctomycetota bacterium]|nr:MAG: hypothetical protein DRP65_12545 [Planctomycetota bacterium]